MRRFLRILSNTAVSLSLVLFAATLVLWVWSYRTAHWFDQYESRLSGIQSELGERSWNRSRDLIISRGMLGWYSHEWLARLTRPNHGWARATRDPASVPHYRRYPTDATDEVIDWEHAGLSYFTFRSPSGVWGGILRVGIAYPATLMLVPPLIWLRCWWRRRPRHPDHHAVCVICNYDLRATPDRCPECGAVPAAAQEARLPTPGGD
ncbi:MAG: hypothetical protein JWN40_2378 [Phycisphaerales bacterium]|nr:hypothetical protein [Phycisphaerales bacterium]